jgi:hypothetical protein
LLLFLSSRECFIKLRSDVESLHRFTETG